jgi:hypothetical protein
MDLSSDGYTFLDIYDVTWVRAFLASSIRCDITCLGYVAIPIGGDLFDGRHRYKHWLGVLVR